MILFASALIIFVFGGILSALAWRSPSFSSRLAGTSAFLGCVLGLISSASVLFFCVGFSASAELGFPLGNVALSVDVVSALFLCVLFGLGAMASLYGIGYFSGSGLARPGRLAGGWLSFNLLLAGMALVLAARHALLFLLAWEGISVAAFFLVAHEADSPDSRRAAWTFLIAAHLGGAFVATLFLLMASVSGSWDFQSFACLSGAGAPLRNLLFVLAIVGFGTKAGFIPFHVWLPEAHPAAPSHVSALMSGIMIKTGIYGLLRVAGMLGMPAAWWGWLLVGIGAISGVLGIVAALAQRDLKRLLAYSSVENMGIITLGLGVGFLGWHYGEPGVLAAGMAGALMHVVNHAFFKGMLFMGAGAVLHATGCKEMDRLGGLLKRMPVTGTAFFVCAAAIVGLPPLNGFLSEFLVYLSALRAFQCPALGLSASAVAVVCALALVGGLAAACFVKAAGVVFLGLPRDASIAEVHEPHWSMRAPMLLLAAACAIMGLIGWVVIPPLGKIVALLTADSGEPLVKEIFHLRRLLAFVSAFGATLALGAGILAFARRRTLRARSVGSFLTWDCGFAGPTPRMQYTAASFAQPLTELFQDVLRPRRNVELPSGFFPVSASWETHPEDMAREQVYRPMFALVERISARIRKLQEGRVQFYLLYMALTLLVLLLAAL